MAIKYFCDVCKKEIEQGSRIHIMGSRLEIKTLCNKCWSKAENILLGSLADGTTKTPL